MPVPADDLAAAKAAAFLEELKRLKEKDLIRLIRKVPMDRDPALLAAGCARTIESLKEHGGDI